MKMLPNDLLSDILHSTPENAASDGYARYFADLAKQIGSDSPQALTEHLTQRFVPKWHAWAHDFYGTSELAKYEISVIPSPIFSAETMIQDGTPYIVIHHGLLDLLSYGVECDILNYQLQKVAADSRSTKQLARRFDALTRHLYHAFLDKPDLLPNFREWFDSKMNKTEDVLLYGAEIFIILHEIAHITLGHLKRRACDYGGRIPWRQQEFEADIEALNVEHKADDLLLGACTFLWWYTIYEAWTRKYREFHPLGQMRFFNLLNNLPPGFDPVMEETMREDFESLRVVESGVSNGYPNNHWMGDMPPAEEACCEMFAILDTVLQ